MLATAGAALPRPDDDWGFEFKWDGIRALVFFEAGRVTLRSRNDADMTVSYPELAGLADDVAEALGHVAATVSDRGVGAIPEPRAAAADRGADTVLDGEIVALGADGRPDFGALQQRMHVVDPTRAARLSHEVPVTLLLFDVLVLQGRPVLELPYRERRVALDELALDGPHWRTTPWFRGGGADVLDVARQRMLEGVLAKRLTSPYRPGQRTREWIKVKLFSTQEVVVGGWSPGQGRRSERIGALLIGVPHDGELRYVGKVGTGFSDTVLRRLLEALEARRTPTSPFALERPSVPGVPAPVAATARWARPELVGEVAYSGWTSDGRLRHPSWRGLRPDKRPADVVREREAPPP
jgi:bifunctional non-homologous end joining protein LigD